jgi:hypothetical protein
LSLYYHLHVPATTSKYRSQKFESLRIPQPHHIPFSLVGRDGDLPGLSDLVHVSLPHLVLPHHAYEAPVLEWITYLAG